MMFEDAQFEAEMHNIDPSLTCRCDEVHICQQCKQEIADLSVAIAKHIKILKSCKDRKDSNINDIQ